MNKESKKRQKDIDREKDWYQNDARKENKLVNENLKKKIAETS